MFINNHVWGFCINKYISTYIRIYSCLLLLDHPKRHQCYAFMFLEFPLTTWISLIFSDLFAFNPINIRDGIIILLAILCDGIHPKHPQSSSVLLESICLVHEIFQSRPILLNYNNFNFPVIWSITLFGAGPIPNTVWLPLAIWVLPASAICSATTPKLIACACKICNSSSDFTCSATFAWPSRSQRRRMGELGSLREMVL